MVISKNLTMPVTHPFNDNGSGTAPIHNDNADEQRLAQMDHRQELERCSAVFGWIFTTASTNLIYAQSVTALVALYRNNFVVQPWMSFVVYEGFNIISCGIVMFGNRWMPTINEKCAMFN
ncbi:hypothetical protein ASPCADRAFT_129448 [Aspergillus carbonarius ITEM 5010]|uniref:Uncharacterized protein n=1 Tax=Aspergillus carbonarius (strain ITEM 5010) TaxID=602072 RepID=A0A1R3RPE6_ASPC5|nr:hypothetical protein ASPCADRAFT_129448 [Aspergillus carbonarius ITEM 5010]